MRAAHCSRLASYLPFRPGPILCSGLLSTFGRRLPNATNRGKQLPSIGHSALGVIATTAGREVKRAAVQEHIHHKTHRHLRHTLQENMPKSLKLSAGNSRLLFRMQQNTSITSK